MESGSMPLIGVGHSLGTVLLVLMSCDAGGVAGDDIPAPQRNVLMSFNNQNINDPLIQFVDDAERAFFPSAIRAAVQWPLDAWRSWLGSGPLVRGGRIASAQLKRLLSEEMATSQPGSPYLHRVIKQSYKPGKTLLVRFDGDGIDESGTIYDDIVSGENGATEQDVQLESVDKVNRFIPHMTPALWQQSYEPDNLLLRAWQCLTAPASVNAANVVASWLSANLP